MGLSDFGLDHPDSGLEERIKQSWKPLFPNGREKRYRLQVTIAHSSGIRARIIQRQMRHAASIAGQWRLSDPNIQAHIFRHSPPVSVTSNYSSLCYMYFKPGTAEKYTHLQPSPEPSIFSVSVWGSPSSERIVQRGDYSRFTVHLFIVVSWWARARHKHREFVLHDNGRRKCAPGHPSLLKRSRGERGQRLKQRCANVLQLRAWQASSQAVSRLQGQQASADQWEASELGDEDNVVMGIFSSVSSNGATRGTRRKRHYSTRRVNVRTSQLQEFAAQPPA
ncbi:hypothetical protein L210DRAFT_3510258 [Boletus edulis BED1]|uniref:Uncharacterized protein n=1 Tax=Boletus edulis BED1 TaxID=1328754 RepID=A0AAD4BCX1_BOLED|nr:hypothetical protein L210DRAFT_3510258 [Boletus edulis BED1]